MTDDSPQKKSSRRVLVIGGPGSGTSTLAAELASQRSWDHLETDDFQWLDKSPPFTRKVDSARRLINIVKEMDRDEVVVVAGSIIGWGEALEDTFDLIVFRILDTTKRLQRIIERERRLYADVDPAFLEWAAHYESGGRPGRSRSSHEAWLTQRTCKVLRLEGDLDLSMQVSMVLEALESLR